MNQPQVPSHPPKWLPPTMWAIFTIILLVTLTLSFQTGTATKALEKPLVSQVTNTMTTLPSEEAILTITYYIRQIGRALLFFLLGLTGSWLNPPYLPQNYRQEPVPWNCSYVVYNIVTSQKK